MRERELGENPETSSPLLFKERERREKKDMARVWCNNGRRFMAVLV